MPGRKPGTPRSPGSGRKKGTPNKITIELKEAAREFTDAALKTLVDVMKSGSDAARVAAANAILDRGYGKPKQDIGLDAPAGLNVTVIERRIVDPIN